MKKWTGRSERSSQIKISTALKAALVVFVLLLGSVYFIDALIDEKQEVVQESYGSLEGRFKPDMTLVVDGKEYGYFDNYFTNVLVIGVDKEEIASENIFRSGGQADFLMLLSVDRRNQTITPIHIDRDTIADVKVYSPFGHAAGVNRMQICLSYAFGNSNELNCANTIWAVERLLRGISIDQFLTLDMTGITILNDALGGVQVTLEEDFSHLDPEMVQGSTLTLRGKQAEYFVRGRHEIGDQTNRQRMARQRVFLENMTELFNQKAEKDSDFILSLFDALEGHMYTSMDNDWLNRQLYVLQNYRQKEIMNIEGEHQIGRDGYMEFHVADDALKRLIRNVFLVEEKEDWML